jgi:hypothetical protein
MDDTPRQFRPLVWAIWRVMMVIALGVAIGIGMFR